MDMALFHMIRVASHASRLAGINWFPWSNHPERNVIGWKGEPHDGSPPIYCYMVPDMEATSPSMLVYMGDAGDPALDALITSIEVTP